MAGSGSFAVAFNRTLTGSAGIFGRRYDASGAPLGGEFRASAVGVSSGEVDIGMDNDGDYVVAWTAQDIANGPANLHTRLYAASGTPLMPARSYGFGFVEFPKVAMDAVGNFVVTWVRRPGDYDIFAQHFAGPDDTRPGCAGFIAGIVGTVGNDSLQGTSGEDVIQGLAGNDILKGGGGADIICGGPGDDQLFGEAGRDHLLGGPGDDVLDGGDGKDRCNGNRQTNADTALACEAVLQVP
jgi:Ca2+-binding RTX toxin-like protein